MKPLDRSFALTVAAALLATFGHAQGPPLTDPPAEHKPARPRTKEELARREARVLYGLGLVRQQHDRLLDATKLFEDARALDARAAPVHKALATLYGALGRPNDALAAFQKALELDAEDHECWYAYARQLKGQGQFPDARTALRRAAACKSLAEHADLYLQVHHDLGTLHEDARAYEEAVAAFALVARVLENPDRLRALDGPLEPEQLREQAAGLHERIIRLWIQAGKHDRAIAAFEQAVTKYPALATRLNLQLAKVHLALDQLPAALARLDDYLRTQPVSTEGYELKATVLEKLGRSADVLPALEAHAHRDPHNLALQHLVGRHMVRAGRFESAETFYQELLKKHAPQPEIYKGLFSLYHAQQRMEKVLFLLDRTLTTADKRDLLPGDAAAAARARDMMTVLREDQALVSDLVPQALRHLDTGQALHADTCFLLATLAAQAKQLAAADRLYRRCLVAELDPRREAAVYDGLLRVLWELRKYADIVWLCERGLRAAAGASRLLFHVNHARALVLLGRVEEGLAEADRAVAVALDDDMRFVTRTTRLRLLMHAGRHEQALAECHALLKERLQPAQLRDVRYLLSGLHSALRDYPRAEEQLRHILKEDPDDATACNDLGYLWADQGKELAEAERLIRKALELDREHKKAAGVPESDNAAFLDSLGWVLFRRGDVTGAREWLEKAATQVGGAEDPVVWDHLGDVYSRMGERARAASAWRKALDLHEKDTRRKADDRILEIRRKLQQE